MSAVIAENGADVAPTPRGKKKLLIMGAAGLAVSLALAGGAIFYLKQRAAHAAALAVEQDGGGAAEQSGHVDPKTAPTYLPLDPFVVNLADKEADRFAQIGITLELDNGVSGEQIKAYMPAIRNAILLVLAGKNAHELMSREGKEQLAEEIRREAVRPMGIVIAAPEPVTAAPVLAPTESAASGAEPMAAASAVAMHEAEAKPKPKRHAEQRNPIQHVHFSSFIIQ